MTKKQKALSPPTGDAVDEPEGQSPGEPRDPAEPAAEPAMPAIPAPARLPRGEFGQPPFGDRQRSN